MTLSSFVKNTAFSVGTVIALSSSLASTAVLANDSKYKPAPERKLELSANVAIGTDYVFRGYSQTAEHGTVQGGFDATYGQFYTGIWASNVNFGATNPLPGVWDTDIEIDVYAGVKPKYKNLGFDLGVIGYFYPGANDDGSELDYLELKAGVSAELSKEMNAGFVAFWSPDYNGEVGEVWTFELNGNRELPKILSGRITPTFGAMVGASFGEEDTNPNGINFSNFYGNGRNHYWYWNAGLEFAFREKFSLDVRYWDTDISNANNYCTGASFQCDARFVVTLKASF